MEGKEGRQSRVAGTDGRGCYKLWAVTMGAGKIGLDLKDCSELAKEVRAGEGFLHSTNTY